ncbi:MAG: SDR family NAD(P)-dependent oxidoreductase, partial [Paracoccaceae bacterium]
MNRIENKVAIVTGGTQGLGAAIAWQFAQAGAKAILTCGRNAENGSQVATKITQSTGVPVVFIQADLESVADCRNVVTEADTRFGQVDILVNAAGL